jgi:cytochrome c-type biogenesis protein CcmE
MTTSENTGKKKNGRFMVGLVGVAAVVTYLIWTGVSETMVYYLTPVELMAKVQTDPTFYDVGVKVSGQVVKGSWVQGRDGENDRLLHTFVVHDLADASVTFPVEFRDALPDTFTDEVEVVMDGRLRHDGVFEATTMLTKCGSRYEAAPEDLATEATAP